MKYLSLIMKMGLMLIGLYIMYTTWTPFSIDCLTGLSIFITGLYFVLQGKQGSAFTGCAFKNEEKTKKKRNFFGK